MTSIDEMFLEAVETELLRARSLFPSSICSYAALVEEVGELGEACLELVVATNPKSMDNLRAEAVQVAVMAMRVATEGDASITGIDGCNLLLAMAALGATAKAHLKVASGHWPPSTIDPYAQALVQRALILQRDDDKSIETALYSEPTKQGRN